MGLDDKKPFLNRFIVYLRQWLCNNNSLHQAFTFALCHAVHFFYKLIQQHLVDGDAAVIMHIGHEGLRYLDAGMTAITKNDVRMFSMTGAAEKGVRHFLDDENWKLVI